ncbi:IclR family transcriptional regulator [Mesorhizobium sp. CAU 1741]|uniref:IclR family transcriptional regulator n=1 Tax=Mesorhizobium sp. CAU 1741 TaxID=3140366 RepID=UPI00325AF2E1
MSLILPATDAEAPQRRERSVDRILQILEFLHGHGEGIRIGALAKALNAPRSSTYTLVNDLTQAGLLEISPDDGRIFFGKRMYLYGLNYIRENSLAKRARMEVDRLAKETGETSEFCMLQSGRYTIMHMRPGNRPFRISSAVGLQIPIPWTASGRLLLAGHDRAQIEALIAEEDLVLPDGRRIDIDEFIDAIDHARRDGFCLTKGLVDAVTQCLAAPIYGAEGNVEATICLVLPIDLSDEQTAALRETLLDSSSRLSAR